MSHYRISHSAIKRLQLELDRLERQAKREIDNLRTRSLGTMRLDLIEECRRRLKYLSYMAKDAEEHADERWRSRDGED
jgi:hypothetical protein